MKELRGFLGWTAVLFGPPVLLLVLAAHPTMADDAGGATLALLVLLIVAGLWRRDSLFAVPIVLLLMQAVVLPKMSLLFMLSSLHASMGPLGELRASVDAYEKKEGHPPAALADLGPVPEAEIWGRNADDKSHYHAPSRAVQTLALPPADAGDAPPAGLRDTGGWAYDPASGRVALACTGLDPKLGRPFYRK